MFFKERPNNHPAYAAGGGITASHRIRHHVLDRCVLRCFDTVGWAVQPVQSVPEKGPNYVSGGTLKPYSPTYSRAPVRGNWVTWPTADRFDCVCVLCGAFSSEQRSDQCARPRGQLEHGGRPVGRTARTQRYHPGQYVSLLLHDKSFIARRRRCLGNRTNRPLLPSPCRTYPWNSSVLT